jgi:hypothetical protein
MKKIVALGSIIVVSLIIGFTIGNAINTKVVNIPADTNIVVIDETDLNVVKRDLITYEKLSLTTINELITAIDSASNKWNIPVGLLHAVFRVESEYNFWIDHPKVTVTIKDTRKTVQAVGLGGVIWEFWSDSLAKHNIALKRSDLYLPEKNVQASAAILRWITDRKLKKQGTTEYNLINQIISGYYGAYDSQYHSKMMRITSDLWLKRIARVLFIRDKKIKPKPLELITKDIELNKGR